jgi:RNA polymerase sigma factor (sigma-70 family)
LTLTSTLAPPRRTPAAPARYSAGVATDGNTTTSPSLDAAFAAGHADLRSVYDAHGSLVYRICRKSLDEHTANDVTQEVFVSAWKARDQYDPARGTLAAWLVGITKRRIIDHLRSEGRHADRRTGEPTEISDPGGEAEIGRTVDRMLVAEALRQLPERARQVITLAYLEGLTHPEITDRTGLPLGTVKSDIRRGLARIRENWEVNHA